MQQCHGIGYNEYALKLEKRIQVEKRREIDYVKSAQIVNDLQRRVHF
ncbi:hypothetical protein [Bacillus sp. M6-12]|nr:hypothetical protein [Bacillus sp. M6-12]